MSQKKVQLHGGQLLLGAFSNFMSVVKAACGEDEEGRKTAAFADTLVKLADEKRGGKGKPLFIPHLSGAFVDALQVVQRENRRPKKLPSLTIVDGHVSLQFELNPPRPKKAKAKAPDAGAAQPEEEPWTISVQLSFYCTEDTTFFIYVTGSELLVDAMRSSSLLDDVRHRWQSAA